MQSGFNGRLHKLNVGLTFIYIVSGSMGERHINIRFSLREQHWTGLEEGVRGCLFPGMVRRILLSPFRVLPFHLYKINVT